jgi:hypothetical protein
MQTDDVLQIVDEMLDADPTLNYMQALERVQMVHEFEFIEPVNAYVH